MPHCTIQTNGAIVYRTVLMELARAAAFARMLDANSRFLQVEISEPRGKSGKHFVSFRPSSTDRQGALYQEQIDVRADRAEDEGMDYIFWADPDFPGSRWCFNPKGGETYQVEIFRCSCPDYEFRCKNAGIPCKHMDALQLQADAGTLGRTEKVTETADERRARIIANIARDF